MPTPHKDTKIDIYSAAFLQMHAHQILRSKVKSVLEKYSLYTKQWVVLGLLSKNKNYNSKQLAESIQVTKAYVSNMINELVLLKYVELKSSKKDKRSKKIKLTRKANLVLKNIKQEMDNVLWETVKPSTKEDVKIYFEVLLNIIENK